MLTWLQIPAYKLESSDEEIVYVRATVSPPYSSSCLGPDDD